MIYVTGDLHGDIARLKSKAIRALRKEDYLVVCGDFGFVWDNSEKERSLLRWIGKRKFTTLFVEGTHDNAEILGQYPVVEWNGGLVHHLSGRLYHMIRGSVFSLGNEKIFAFGGGESFDSDNRFSNGVWSKDEMPTEEQISMARANLLRHNNAVDYIVTYQTGKKMKQFLQLAEREFNILDVFFDEVKTSCKYSYWFFGNYHMNKIIPPGDYAVFDNIIPTHDVQKKRFIFF